jgi:hypothetical protein
MAKITIIEAELLEAFESGDGMIAWFLDGQTGELIPLMEFDEIEEEKEIRRAIDEDEEGRYLPVPSIESHEGFRIMEDFADAQDDGRVRGALIDALERRRPFRSFKDALMAFPEVRDRWFAYHQEQMREHAVDWLKIEGIDAELTRPVPPVRPP